MLRLWLWLFLHHHRRKQPLKLDKIWRQTFPFGKATSDVGIVERVQDQVAVMPSRVNTLHNWLIWLRDPVRRNWVFFTIANLLSFPHQLWPSKARVLWTATISHKPTSCRSWSLKYARKEVLEPPWYTVGGNYMAEIFICDNCRLVIGICLAINSYNAITSMYEILK